MITADAVTRYIVPPVTPLLAVVLHIGQVLGVDATSRCPRLAADLYRFITHRVALDLGL
ncbi:hypothetical protein [Nonomuraea glycinis]|uniref:hypothetical protein n=1 Tax=Nonomuraea glycinis TaxID=2047744 RepID=UPI002E1475A0|nr:hypothetical protein OHA68_00925 [Nonomuraea glycinis]